jgi:hypothetical protein
VSRVSRVEVLQYSPYQLRTTSRKSETEKISMAFREDVDYCFGRGKREKAYCYYYQCVLPDGPSMRFWGGCANRAVRASSGNSPAPRERRGGRPGLLA